jgi:hypothetical protein
LEDDMTTAFGPQLLGQTEKTLQALLERVLDGTCLNERLWVTLRLADQPDDMALRERVADRARFDDADVLVTELEREGLVADEAPTAEGHAMLETVLARSAAVSGPIWDDIDDADAAARALTVVLARARAALGASV